MKKLTFLMAILFASVVVFGQNTTTINQSGGSGNDADVSQNGLLNVATVDQIGTTNFVVVNSQGTGNIAEVVQNGLENGDASRPDLGYIKQDGISNEAYLHEGEIGGPTSDFADGFIDQKGNGNSASLTSYGQYHNEITHGIVQIQDENIGSEGNTATVVQQYYGNDANIYQEGSANNVNGITDGQGNQFYVLQEGLANIADINIFGDNNSTGKSTNWWYAPTARNWNYLDQYGQENTGMLDLQGNDNLFKLYQTGYLNIAKVILNGDALLDAYQDGDENLIAGIDNCYATEWAELYYGSSLDVDQFGDNNKLYVSVHGDVTISQNNTASTDVGNIIKYEQTGSGTTGLTQLGDENLISLYHGGTGDVTIGQTGNGNKVASFVDVFDDPAILDDPCCASFYGTSLTVTQTGNDNLLHLNSTGLSDIVSVTQTGSFHTSSVVQHP